MPRRRRSYGSSPNRAGIRTPDPGLHLRSGPLGPFGPVCPVNFRQLRQSGLPTLPCPLGSPGPSVGAVRPGASGQASRAEVFVSSVRGLRHVGAQDTLFPPKMQKKPDSLSRIGPCVNIRSQRRGGRFSLHRRNAAPCPRIPRSVRRCCRRPPRRPRSHRPWHPTSAGRQACR